MRRTNSGFVVVQVGFFREGPEQRLYATKPGFYATEECLKYIPGTDDKYLSLPEYAKTLVPRVTLS